MQCAAIGNELVRILNMSSPVKRSQPPSKPDLTEVQTAWQGPLPPPESVKRFDEIVTNGAERIFRMAEMEQQHRIHTEQLAIQSNVAAANAEIKAAGRGTWMGFIVSTLAIAGAILTSYTGGHWSVSVALVSIPVMGVVRTLVIRK